MGKSYQQRTSISREDIAPDLRRFGVERRAQSATLAERAMRRKFALPESRARLICELAGLGGAQ